MCLNFETPKINNFPFWNNGKLIISDVLILKHIRLVLSAAFFGTLKGLHENVKLEL